MKVFLLALACLALPAFAQYKMEAPAGQAPGPWLLGTIGVGKGADGKPLTTALKGLAIKLGENGEAGIAYDLDLCRVAGVWTGGKFVTPMNLMSRGEYPTASEGTALVSGDVAGFWLRQPDDLPRGRNSGVPTEVPWKDARKEPFGPLPEGEVRFRGFRTEGNTVAIDWEVGGVKIVERPGVEVHNGLQVITRSFEIAPFSQALLLSLCAIPDPQFSEPGTALKTIRDDASDGHTVIVGSPGVPLSVTVKGDVNSGFYSSDGQLWFGVPASKKPLKLRVEYLGRQPETVATSTRPEGQSGGAKGLRRPEIVETTGELSKDTESGYVVDTIKVPDQNPWKAPMFIGGLDFFADGRAAVCTFHGDVFIVDGLKGDLSKVTWRRFASGLYHALGLRIVKGEIYVTCRDGLWKLRDLNGDGECDSYEAFNFDVKVTKSFHEFVFDLQTDTDGNFYFAKAGPVKNGGRGFDEIMEHHGTLMRVTPDGKKLEVVATGFRAPNGIGIGIDGQLTSGDNEGTWTPVCRLNWIQPGGFYGVVPLAHRDTPPDHMNVPLCWLPKRVDNSSGGQVWVTSDKWGPWRNELLHLSYGQCALYGVLKEEADAPQLGDCCEHVMQGGVVKFPLQFQSGIMRARFNPQDGQLWAVGMRGWQTSATKNGCLQRVRYTGKPVRMPIALHVKKDGIELQFTSSLDTQAAADPQNWNVEVWNYIYSSAYGSPEISTLEPTEKPSEAGKDGVAQFTKTQMGKPKHDPLEVKRVSIGTDDRTVFLEIPGLKPVMQMSIRYGIKAADGAEIKGEVVNTIHGFGQ